jgi:uncharacterized repeat protein (TIGR01451 family)
MRGPEAVRFAFRLTVLAILLSTGAAVAWPAGAQAIPDIRGSYQAQGTSTVVCSGSKGSSSGAGTLTIPTQQQQAFSGTISTPSSIPIVLNGDVDQTGMLTGTYSFSGQGISGSGTFTGQGSGNQIQLDLTGTESVPGSITCDETFAITGTRGSTTGPQADLSITQTASTAQVASGDQITYTLVVSNAGPAAATGVLVADVTPAGTTFASATTDPITSQGPGPGAAGVVTFSVGALASGSTAKISLTVNVLAPGGTVLVNSPFVVSDLSDPNIKNNSSTLSAPVAGGAVIRLVWDEPAPTAANPTPAPENLRVVLVAAAESALELDRITPQDSCTLTAVNIYKSDQPNVQTIPANLWETVPPNMLQATMAAAPAGSFYVITNLWNCGGTVIESGPSNQASVPAGPAITKLKVTAKLKAIGTGFSGPVQVLVDGVEFKKKAVLQGSGIVIQKGTLTDGTPINSIGVTKSVLITIVNKDGGLGTFAFKRP